VVKGGVDGEGLVCCVPLPRLWLEREVYLSILPVVLAVLYSLSRTEARVTCREGRGSGMKGGFIVLRKRNERRGLCFQRERESRLSFLLRRGSAVALAVLLVHCVSLE